MKVALDIGNRNVKIGWIENNRVCHQHTTSIFGQGRKKEMGTLATGLTRAKADYTHTLIYDNISQIVGKNTHLHVRNIDGFTHQRFEDGRTLRPLAYSALSYLPGDEVSTIIGLPITVMQQNGIQAMKGIRSWLGGKHSFELDDLSYSITIDKIKGLAQPLGTWARFMYNDRGEWINDKNAPCIIIDLGFYTLDIFAIENREITPRHTIGENSGIYLAAGSLAKQIKTEFDIDITLHQADLLLEHSLNNSSTLFYHPKGCDDISSLIQSILSTTFLKHNTIIADALENAQYRYLIGTGGGILYYEKELPAEYRNLKISNDPINDNVGGLTILAQKLL